MSEVRRGGSAQVESFVARAVPRVLTVAWMAALAGLAIQFLVLASDALGGSSVPAARFLADLAQGIGGLLIICGGIALGTLLERARASAMGLLGLVFGPLGWIVAKGADKVVPSLVGLQWDQVGGFFYVVAALKGAEYAILGVMLGSMLSRPGARARQYALMGFMVGLVSACVFGFLAYRYGVSLGSPRPSGGLAAFLLNELLFPAGCALVIFMATRVKAPADLPQGRIHDMPTEPPMGTRPAPSDVSGYGEYDASLQEAKVDYDRSGRAPSTPDDLIAANKAWARERLKADPKFFSRLSKVQRPQFLWIGCSDSRVPANEIVNLQPGELFVHRNVANVVPHTDLNCLAVIQYAVEYLGVKHIIVVGHYDCGGVKAAMSQVDHGQIDNWLAHVKDVYSRYYDEIRALKSPSDQLDRLCELNVTTQVRNVAKTSIVQHAWRRRRNLSVHGWIYGVEDGILRDLGVTMSAVRDLHAPYRILE